MECTNLAFNFSNNRFFNDSRSLSNRILNACSRVHPLLCIASVHYLNANRTMHFQYSKHSQYWIVVFVKGQRFKTALMILCIQSRSPSNKTAACFPGECKIHGNSVFSLLLGTINLAYSMSQGNSSCRKRCFIWILLILFSHQAYGAIKKFLIRWSVF